MAYNRAAWDLEVENRNEWTEPAGPEVIARARAGDWSVVLIGYQVVPRDWFPSELVGAEVLCLASGGGQQGPVLSAAGAAVTVLDNSPRQLGRDREVATREGLAVRTVLGDMRDLSVFPDASFDVVFNPVSNVFCPELAPVWRESFRVLRPGGILMAGFLNPNIFIFDITALEERGELMVRHQLPFSSLDLPDAERQRSYGTGPIEYSHSLAGQIGGQLAAGFTLTHLDEGPHHADATARYMPGYFATQAIKPKPLRGSARVVVHSLDDPNLPGPNYSAQGDCRQHRKCLLHRTHVRHVHGCARPTVASPSRSPRCEAETPPQERDRSPVSPNKAQCLRASPLNRCRRPPAGTIRAHLGHSLLSLLADVETRPGESCLSRRWLSIRRSGAVCDHSAGRAGPSRYRAQSGR
ncbi:MAG: class I SAM-dependent methyltransferase [Pseudonocardiaceae bacterium]